MTTATHRRRLALQLSTALATTVATAGLAAPAFGQDILPTGNTTVAGSATVGAGPTAPGGGGSLSVDLQDTNSVITWSTYNIGQTNAVYYVTPTTTAGSQYAVLNRVVTMTPSQIDGLIDSSNGGLNNIAVWLVNGSGIVFGSGGSYNGGSLVLSTLDVPDADFLNGGGFTLGSSTGAGTGTITLNGGTGLLNSTGSVIIAAQEISTSKSITGATGVALVAAQEVNFSAGVGSPLSYTIATGTTLNGVRVLGTATLNGASVALAAASASAATSTLLGTDAGTTLTATSASGAVVLDAGTGAVSAAGFVDSAGDYTVKGGSVALGDQDGSDGISLTEQRAAGNVDVTATAGDITGGSGLTLTSDSDGVGGGNLVLDAAAGKIDFATASTIRAGSAGTGSVGLIYDTTKNLSLGNVTAATLGGVSGSAGSRNTFTTSLTTSGDFTANTINVVGALANYTAGGNMRLGSLDAGEIVLNVGGDLTGLAGASTGTSDPAYGRANLKSETIEVSATVGGLAQLGTVDAKTSASISGGNAVSGKDGSVDATSVIARGGNVNLTAFSNDAPVADAGHDGDILLGSGQASGSLTLSNSAGTNGNITAGALTAPTGVTVNAAKTATLSGNVSAIGGTYTVTGADIVLGNGSGAVTQSADGTSLTPSTGGITLAGDVTLSSVAGGAISLNGAVDGAHALTINTTGNTNLGNVGATTALTSLTTDAGGTTFLNGGTITTTGAQTFGDTVQLNTSVTATGTTGTAAAVLGNGKDLTLNYTGATVIDGALLTGVNNLATGNGGATVLTGTIATTGTQTYGDAVLLAGATTLSSSGLGTAGDIALGSSVNGAQTLTVNTAGTTTFGGTVGS